MRYLALRNWKQYQHYNDRNPPWIKLYNSILDDYDFSKLSDETKWHVVACTLLASRTGNRIPADPKWIASKTGSSSKVVIEDLLSSGMFELFQDDTNTDAHAEHDASSQIDQSRAEGETEREKNLPNAALLNEQFDRIWTHIPKKVDKEDTRREFKKALKDADFDLILSRVMAWAKREQGKDKQYIKSPKRWFSGKHWEDEPVELTEQQRWRKNAERALM